MDFQVGTTDLTIEGAYECKNDSKIVFELWNEQTKERLYLIWNLDTNSEVGNFSTKEKARYVQGEFSDSGYLLMHRSYVNLDYCIQLPFFKYDLRKLRKFSSI